MPRLQSWAQFQAVLAARTVSRTPHFALHRLPVDASPAAAPPDTGPESSGSQALFVVGEVSMGALVPKRWARRAVTRNAIRRQIHDMTRQFAPRLPHAAHVVRLRAPFDKAVYPSASSDALKRAVRDELQLLFAQGCPT